MSIKKVLFQGDSITDGARGRTDDPNHILGHSYTYVIAGKLLNELPDSQLHFTNRGISGNRVSDLYARWNEDAIHLAPDLISILIGVNDAVAFIDKKPSGATDRFERVYRHLLEETKEMLPNAGGVLCEPFVLQVGCTIEKWALWKETISKYQRITRQLANEYHAVFVPLQDKFYEASQKNAPCLLDLGWDSSYD